MSEWNTLSFVEIPMNAEIGSYSDMLADEPPPAAAAEPSVQASPSAAPAAEP
jgi:hypothetical protein